MWILIICRPPQEAVFMLVLLLKETLLRCNTVSFGFTYSQIVNCFYGGSLDMSHFYQLVKRAVFVQHIFSF